LASKLSGLPDVWVSRPSRTTLIGELETIDKKIKATEKELKDLVIARGSTLMGLHGAESTGRRNTSTVEVFHGVGSDEIDGWPSAAICGSGGQAADAVTRATGDQSARGAAGVLEADRRGHAERASSPCVRRVDPGRNALVSRRWGHVTDQLGRAFGPLPVGRGARGDRDLESAAPWRA
jgi:hypothetical protein